MKFNGEKAAFGRHETFALRFGWLTKGAQALMSGDPVFEAEDATVRLGVGKNMVSSIRYWLQAARIIERNESGWTLTRIGELIFDDDGYDPYLEDEATIWLLHWLIASNPQPATTWWWFFNRFHKPEFTGAELTKALQDFAKDEVKGCTSASTLKSDSEVLRRMYVCSMLRGQAQLEDTRDSPLSVLGLVTVLSDLHSFESRPGQRVGLPTMILGFAVLELFEALGESQLLVSDLMYGPTGYPALGAVLRLSEGALFGKLKRLDNSHARRARIPRDRWYPSALSGRRLHTPANARSPLRRQPRACSRMSLADQIIVNAQYTRSVDLERDCDSPTVVRGYIPTPRALHTLGRIADTLDAEVAPRAWSLVGPYGAGKSSFAAFLTHLLGAPEADNTQAALEVLDAAEPALAQRFRPEGEDAKAHPGHCVAVLTGSPEPFGKRLAAALADGAARYWAERIGPRPDVIESLRRLSDGEQVTTSELMATVSALQDAIARACGPGLLLIIDELGKFLEYEARPYGANDIFLLQALAERANAAHGAKLTLVVLLHQAMDQYARGLGDTLRNECFKVRGRFKMPLSGLPAGFPLVRPGFPAKNHNRRLHS